MDCHESLIRKLPPDLHWHRDGEIRLVGHRVGLYHIVFYHNQGLSPDTLRRQFPTLEPSLIQRIVSFYLENRDAVDEYVAHYQAELDQLRASGVHARAVIEFNERTEGRRRANAIDAG
jgi:uncharacterized protein (DUF433 family)